MLRFQAILSTPRNHFTFGVNEQYVATPSRGRSVRPPQHQDAGRDGRASEDVRTDADHRFQSAVLDYPSADIGLHPAPEQDSVRSDDSPDSVRLC